MDLYILAIIPLILFVIMDLKFGMKAGVITAIAVAIAITIYFRVRLGEWDEFMVGETILICLLGGISIKMENSRYFKFQPAVMSLIFAVVCAFYQFFDEPILVKILPQMMLLAPNLKGLAENTAFQKQLESLSHGLIYTFAAHTWLVYFAAIRKNNLIWILSRLAIYPMILLMVILVSLIKS